ncbi:MAG: T9SS type A sorting domain-containing protein [Flavobacteriales bacterium]|jgi:hypothetical protein|nr:T9SS type A sorting domain-containing protein [Flavobacteriales bacterium]
MKTCLLPALALLTATAASAQLAPGTPAPAYAHMHEVNTEWAHMHPLAPGDDRPVRFADEAERIATHLHRVRTTLMERIPEGLSAGQLRHRMALLERLGDYADARTFPQNHVLPFRNPVFIDPYGTACAVGWMMIESGHRDLAEGIDAAMETAYVAEIIADDRFRAPVAQWAGAHGFTADELAWVQPAYPPNILTSPLGGGTDGPVTVTLPLANGDLLVAGSFTQAGGTAALNVAVWDGEAYHALGDGVAGTIECAVEFDGAVHVGGSLLNGSYDLARWDGSAWTFTNALEGKWSAVHALHVHDGALHAAGEMAGFAGIDHLVARLEGGIWSVVGQPFNAPVLALGGHAGQLVAGGAFTGLAGTTDPLLQHVARLTGNDWTPVGDGLDGTVRTFLHKDGMLYAGGDRYVDGAYAFGLARVGDDLAWEPLLGEQGVGPQGAEEDAWIGSLADIGAGLAFGGRFLVDNFMIYGTHLGGLLLDGGLAFPVIVVYDDVHAVAVHAGKVVFGGAFNASSMGELHHIAQVDIAVNVSVGELDAAGTLTAWPNPAMERTSVHLSDPDVRGVQAVDATGRIMELPFQRMTDRIDLRVDRLAPGTYTLHVRTDRAVHSARFVKQ